MSQAPPSAARLSAPGRATTAQVELMHRAPATAVTSEAWDATREEHLS